MVKLSKTKYVYDGKTKNPGVIVLDGDGNRVSSDHYTVSYQAGDVYKRQAEKEVE